MINDVILKKLNLQNNDFLLVFDPDNLLAEEDVVDHINGLGFTIIHYEDPEVFRYFYEENIRSVLDKDEELKIKIIIKYTSEQTIPYDIQLKCSFIELSLRNLFPKLSYSVIKELFTEVIDRLYIAYQNYDGPILGDNGTKEFILKHVYGIIPEAIIDFQDLIKTFIPFYYRGEKLPKTIADYTVEMLRKNNQLKKYPINTVIASKGVFFHFLQQQWEQYIKLTDGEDVATMIDFSNHEIRAYMDNLFQESFLSPVKQLKPREYPSWMRPGIVYDIAGHAQRRFNSGIEKIQSMLRDIKSYKDWFAIAGIWGRLLILKHDHEKDYSFNEKKYIETRSVLNQEFKAWLVGNYGMLASLSYAKAPVMVHQIPWHISYRLRKEGSKKVALIVMDGMSLNDWYVIKDSFDSNSKYIYEESLCFAWIPTITSVSRQAIFSGEIPANFSDTFLSTNYDGKQWKRFWKNNGITDRSIDYKRNIREFDEEGLSDIVEDKQFRVLGLVVNIIDNIMHGQQLFEAGMHQDIRLWTKRGYFQRFLESLFLNGFEVFITSDHGNISANFPALPVKAFSRSSSGTINQSPFSFTSLIVTSLVTVGALGLNSDYCWVIIIVSMIQRRSMA
jgi:hypothetical protein